MCLTRPNICVCVLVTFTKVCQENEDNNVLEGSEKKFKKQSFLHVTHPGVLKMQDMQ